MSSIGATMKCILAKQFGQAKEVLYMSDSHPKPILKPGSGKILVKVHASSLSPGDWRTLSGGADLVRKPPFPYIPCHDTSGTVEELDPKDPNPKFNVGDCVVSTWDHTALNGLAEYMVADPKRSVLKPSNVSHIEASALANSAGHALLAIKDSQIKAGDRVLVLGGSGGVGTVLTQMLKTAQVSFLAATSTQTELLKSLGVDRPIDYTKEDWWEVEDFKTEPFDVIIDFAEGAIAWERAKASKVLKAGKQGGRFLAGTMPNPRQEMHKASDLVGFLGGSLTRTAGSRMGFLWSPKYIMELGEVDAKLLETALDLASSGKLKVVLDPDSPFPFTEEGVKAAFAIQESVHLPGKRQAHGKLVVNVGGTNEE